MQWSIFDALFARDVDADHDRATTLVLVGDPKQAIYGFRGANVHTYLQAAHAAGTELTSLDVNWRSDPAALRANEALLSDATFGTEAIGFKAVRPAVKHADRSFLTRGGDRLPALSIRLATGPGVARHARAPQFSTVDKGQVAVYRELATHVRELLDTAVVPPDDADDAEASMARPLRPDDIAVLISANREGPMVRDAFDALEIPAIIARGENVLESEAASHWHRLLVAVARPANARRARAAASSWFFGWDARRVAQADETDLGVVHEKLRKWGEVLSQRGVAAFTSRVRSDTAVISAVLRRPHGERAATDLEHIAELLSMAGAVGASPSTLLTTFEQLTAGDETLDPDLDVMARRVESDSHAVQIMTTFVAKGLEFPVVCCPSAWRPAGVKTRDNVWWDDESGRRVVDVASKLEWGPDDSRADRQERAAREKLGSNLRLLYVALTRARHHTAIWWLPTSDNWKTGLARVLFARDDAGQLDPAAFIDPDPDPLDEDASFARLAPLADAANGDVELVIVDDPGRRARPWSRVEGNDRGELEVARLDRHLDRAAGRWSFTAITARAHDEQWGFDPFDETAGDGDDADEGVSTRGPLLRVDGLEGGTAGTEIDSEQIEPLLGDIAGGAGFGTLVHEVLERIDFTTADLETEISAAVTERLAWNPWPVDHDRLVAGLAAVARTSLGPLFGDRSLADLKRADRLDEMTFDLLLGNEDSRASDADIGRLVLDHLSPDDPQRPWAEALSSGPFSAVLGGHLTGSIDLVARIDGGTDAERYVVCDYKTNRLAPPGSTATMAHFAPDRLPAAMAEHHYPLQALLYTVALHRYLRWRLPSYDPAAHLGGAGYLFVRGMVGPNTPTVGRVPHGVFEWHPPAALIRDLSDLLDGSRRDG